MKQRIRSALAAVLSVCLLLLSLTACSSQTVQRTDYDHTRYALAAGLDGITFLVPRQFYDSRIPYSSFAAYTAEEQGEHAFEWTGDHTYSIFQPGTYAVYAFYIGTRDHLEGKEDVNTLAQYMGIDGYITFSDRGDGSFETTSNTNTGTIVNTFPVVIHDASVPGIYYGYVTVYRRGDNRVIYALADGFSEQNKVNDAMAKLVSKSILPNDLVK